MGLGNTNSFTKMLSTYPYFRMKLALTFFQKGSVTKKCESS